VIVYRGSSFTGSVLRRNWLIRESALVVTTNSCTTALIAGYFSSTEEERREDAKLVS
jgi:hypothetical protein